MTGDDHREYSIMDCQFNFLSGWIYRLSHLTEMQGYCIHGVPEANLILVSNQKPNDMSKPKFEIDDAVKIGYGSKVYYVQQIEQDSNGFWAYALKSADGSTPRAVESMLSKASLLDDKAIKAKTVCFGQALEALKMGKRFSGRMNGKNMWLVHIRPMSMMTVYPDYSNKSDEQVQLPSLPYIGMKTADDKFVPWLASQTDMLACDWCIMGDEEKSPYPDRIPVPENIKFYSSHRWLGIAAPNGKLLLTVMEELPCACYIRTEIEKRIPNDKLYLIPCKRSDLKPGDIGVRGFPSEKPETDLPSRYSVILNDTDYAFWNNEMDMHIGDLAEDFAEIQWHKVIFE
jgi:hypothetical protein